VDEVLDANEPIRVHCALAIAEPTPIPPIIRHKELDHLRDNVRGRKGPLRKAWSERPKRRLDAAGSRREARSEAQFERFPETIEREEAFWPKSAGRRSLRGDPRIFEQNDWSNLNVC